MKIFPTLIATVFAALFFSGIVRAECNVTVSENTVDYGKLSSSEVSAHRGDRYILDEREVRVNAFCSEPQSIAIFVGDGSGLKRFQFGNAGDVLVTAQQGLLDGRPVDLGKTLTQGSFMPKQGRNRKNVLVLNNEGLLPVRNGEVPVGQQFSFILHLRPMLKAGQHSAQDEDNLLSTLRLQLEHQ